MTAPLACAASASARPSSALLVFVPAQERELAALPGVSLGIMSAAQGSYSPAQLLLDITQGARIANSAYSHNPPAPMSLTQAGAAGYVAGWRAARERARKAPQLLRPGLLASRLPEGAAYAGTSANEGLDAIAAANTSGQIARVSLGSATTLLSRIEALARTRALVVADLPGGSAGFADLRALTAARPPAQLLLVVERARTPREHELLWAGAAGLPGQQRSGRSALTSATTNERGLIASVDLAPTILDHLRLAVPPDMRGRQLQADGALAGASLPSLMSRLQVIGERRLHALAWLLSAWALLLLCAAAWAAALGVDSAPAARAPGWAMRVGALAVLWAPVAVLIGAALEPSAAVEYALIVIACLGLGALSDLTLRWPRALLAPAVVGVLALGIDAVAGTQLLMRSLLGPDPRLGARFYGFGNELKSGLAVLVFAAVAAALYPARRDRRSALTIGCAGVALAAFEGSARVGAGVGGVILVSAGTAVAVVMLLPGALTRRRVLLVLVAPLVGLAALAGLDLLTAHGSGHFTGSILHARSPGDLRDVLVRRYKAAWDELRNHAMPLATALSLLAAVLGVRRRERLLAPVEGDPLWEAALAGGLTAGVVGALVEDSGPVLLVVAMFCLCCVLGYLWGKPRSAEAPLTQRSRDSRAARSTALTPPAEHVR